MYLLLSPREAGFSAFKPVFMSESPPGREHFAAAFSHALSLSFFSCQLAVAKPCARGSSRLGRREKAPEDDGCCWKPYSPAPSVCFLPSTRALKRCPLTARSPAGISSDRSKTLARIQPGQLLHKPQLAGLGFRCPPLPQECVLTSAPRIGKAFKESVWGCVGKENPAC